MGLHPPAQARRLARFCVTTDVGASLLNSGSVELLCQNQLPPTSDCHAEEVRRALQLNARTRQLPVVDAAFWERFHALDYAARTRAMIKDGYDKGGETLTRAAGALGRLHTFAALHHPDDVVDKISGLTGEDLAVLLDLLEKIKAIALPTGA